MPEQQATAGAHSRIIQVIGDGNVVGSQPYLSLKVPSLKPCAVSEAPGNDAALLGPGGAVTTFVGREKVIASFVAWANSHTPERSVSVRVVHGGAGIGKTRFAMELCRALGPGWQAGFVDGTEARRFFRQTNLADWGWQAPTLVVFDYALTLLDVLPDWMRELCSIPESAYPLRIILLERQAGEEQGGWLERAFPGGFGIQSVCPRDLLDGEPLRLASIADFAMQRGIMQDMLTRLGSRLILPPDNTAFRERLARTDWAGAPLFLMMAAVVMHRQGGMGEVLHLGRVDLAHAVAGHEWERLRRACQGDHAGRASLELFLPHMAALATLSGGLPEGLVLGCLRREKEGIGCENLDTAVVKRVLSELLPDEGRTGIAPIRPDIVGEAFVLVRLGNGQTSDGKDAVLRAFADRPSEVAAVLVRCVQDFAPRGADAASAREARDQERALDWLRAVGEKPNLPLPLLLAVVGALPQESVALRPLAMAWQRRAVAILRQQVAVDPELRATLAGHLNNFANRLSDTGQREEALTIAAEAAVLYRELADTNPDAFRPDLAGSLNNLSNRLSELGQRDEALTSASEAVSLYRRLTCANPNAFQKDLAMSLNTLATRLSEAGQGKEAISSAREATELYRELADANPDAFRPDLAGSLSNLANNLSDLGQWKEAITSAREATELYRELADANPDAFRPYLAGSLHNLANRLGETGQREKALMVAHEATRYYRELTAANPDAFRPGLAMSLNNLSTRFRDQGQQKEALMAAWEATGIHYELASTNPDAFRPSLAMSLDNLANCLVDLGQREEALKVAQEAATLYRELASANPDAFRANLAGNLNNLAICLSEVGEHEKALATARESAQILISLYRSSPEPVKQNLIISMTTWLSLRHARPREEVYNMIQQGPEPHIRALLEDIDSDALPDQPVP